jgi:hypothetical protein
MSIEVVRAILVDDAAVSALVADRVSPLERKELNYPAIVLTGSSAPANTLTGWGGRDHVTVTVAYWDRTYTGAHDVANTGRAALEAAGLLVQSEQDEFVPFAALAGLACVEQVLSFWV